MAEPDKTGADAGQELTDEQLHEASGGNIFTDVGIGILPWIDGVRPGQPAEKGTPAGP